MDERSVVEEILHRVNNLLGTIEVQSEVANTIGTQSAFAEALRLIVESARRTKEQLEQLERGDESPGAG